MKRQIEIEEDVYQFLRNRMEIGESASALLRRLLGVSQAEQNTNMLVSPSGPTADPANFNRQVPELDIPRPQTEAGLSRRVAELLIRLSRLRTRQVLDRFMTTLDWVHEQDPERFAVVGRIRGARRVYFSKDRAEIEASGSSTFPQAIGATGWFALTNTSTSHKCDILAEILRMLNYPRDEMEVILQALEASADRVQPKHVLPRDERPSVVQLAEDDDDLRI
jgi:negative regulator of replication initiation